MQTIPVVAASPSATTEPYVLHEAGELVSWHPERGWLCADHHAQPCEHTIDLEPGQHPIWRQ